VRVAAQHAVKAAGADVVVATGDAGDAETLFGCVGVEADRTFIVTGDGVVWGCVVADEERSAHRGLLLGVVWERLGWRSGGEIEGIGWECRASKGWRRTAESVLTTGALTPMRHGRVLVFVPCT